MGRVNRTRAPTSLNARHRSTRFHRATRFRAFRSVLKCIERLPAGFMKKLKWSTPRVGHRHEASQDSGQVIPEGYVASHADTSGYFLVDKRAPQNLQDKQQASNRPLFSAKKTCIRRRDARKHSLLHPNYMGISPTILLEMMVKIARVKWRSPPVSSTARTGNAIMLQAAMSEDSPTMISVKNIEGIQNALRFLGNLPEKVLPTFVQRNSALKRFIRRMETHNTSTASGHTEKPKNDLGIIEQTVKQLQRRGLAKPYLDKLAAYSSGPEAFSMDAETLMQKVLVDATNSAALTSRPGDRGVVRDVDMTDVDTNERNVPKLLLDTSQKRAVISLEGSRCNPINLENFGLPQDLFQDLPNPFLDKSPNIMAISRRRLFQGPPDSVLGKRTRMVLPTDLELLQLSPEEAAMYSRLYRKVYVRAPNCNHAPCMFNTCKNYKKKGLHSPFREVPMTGGPGGDHITTSFQFGDHVEGVQFYQAAIDIIMHELKVVEQNKTPQHKRLENYDTQTPFEELQPIWREFEERGYSELRPGIHEPTKISEVPSAENYCNEMGQSGRGSKNRRQVFFEEEPRPQYTNPELEIKDPRPDGSPIYHPGSLSQISTSSGSDVFVDCEEEISFVRSSPPNEAAETRSEIDSDEVMLRNQLGTGPVYTSQKPKIYSTCSSSSPESAERNPYYTTANKVNKKPPTIFAADMLPNSVADTGLASQASTQVAMATDSILASKSPFVPLSLASEPTAMDGKSCPKCDKPYKYKGFLKRHIRVCQVPGVPEESPLPKHPCPACGKLYKKQGNLWLHIDSCTWKSNNSQSSEFPKQEMKEKKARESLVTFPRYDAKNSSGKPLCEACRSGFTSERELAKHIKAECMTLRAQVSYGRSNNKQPGMPLALSFKEPLSASDFETSDVDSATEIPSSKFAAPLGKYGQNPLQEERQPAKDYASGVDYGVRKGSIAEQLELIYGLQSNYHTPTVLISNTPFKSMENLALDGHPGTNGAGNGDGDDSGMDVTSTPESKPRNIGKLSKLASTMSSRRRLARIGMSPGSELIIDGKTPATVSRVLTLEPGLSELQDTKPRPTSRKLFSNVSSIASISSDSLLKIQDQQAREGFDLEFAPPPTRSPPHKASAAYHERLSKGLGSYRNKPESVGSEIVTIQCPTQVVRDYIVNFLGQYKDDNVRRQIISVSDENGLTVKAIVRPGFDITELKFDELPGVFVGSGYRTFIFAQTGSETGVIAGKDARENQELELETPEKSAKRARGWNLRKENRKQNGKQVHHHR